MAVARIERIVLRAQLATYTEPRSDLLDEVMVEPGLYLQASGPFSRYERIVRIQESGGPLDPVDSAEFVHVAEETRFRMAVPVWGRGLDLLMRRALKESDRTPHHRWWWPSEVVTTHTTTLVALLSLIGMMGAFIGVNIGQTITFAAAEFGASNTAQANALAASRIGVLVSTVVIWRADIIGRKPLLIAFATGASIFTVAGAFSTSLAILTVTQALARGFATGLLTLVTLAATEEIPKTMRSFILSILTMCGALGAGVVIWFLPLAGINERGWRLIYLVPLLFLPIIHWIWRVMPETRRFAAADRVHSPGLRAISAKWFVLLGFIYFATSVFGAPATQLQNEYLRGDIGFNAGQISLFRLLISTPAGLVILLAGWVADRRGRRTIGGVSLAIGAIASAVFFTQEGGMLWLTGATSVWLGGAAFPVIRAYQTELFPTRARALVGGWVDLIGVTGSALGLVIAGQLIQGGRDIGEALRFLLPLPLLVAIMIPLFLPRTAGQALEELNPSDPEIDRGAH